MNEELSKKISEAVNGCEGWCSEEKALVLAKIILSETPAIVVEIGVFGGRSLIPIALALQANGAGVVYGIDPWKLEAALEGDNGKENDEWWTKNMNLHDIHRGCMEAIWKHKVDANCVVIRAKSDDSVSLFADGSIDLLHQDSNHSELVSCREVEKWHRKISAKSLWILDDTDWKSQGKAIQMIQDYGFQVYQDMGNYMIFKR